MEFLDFVPTSSSVGTLPQNVSRGVEPHQPHISVCAHECFCPTRSNEAAVRGLSNIRSAPTSSSIVNLSPTGNLCLARSGKGSENQEGDRQHTKTFQHGASLRPIALPPSRGVGFLTFCVTVPT